MTKQWPLMDSINQENLLILLSITTDQEIIPQWHLPAAWLVFSLVELQTPPPHRPRCLVLHEQ